MPASSPSATPRSRTTASREYSLGFLLADILRLIRTEFRRQATGLRLTPALARLLLYVDQCPGCSQTELAAYLDLTSATVGRMIDRLEDAGLAERRRDPADRRVWRIHLTEKAQPILIELRAIADTMIDEVMEGVDPQDRIRMHAALMALRTNLLSDEHDKANDNKEAVNG